MTRVLQEQIPAVEHTELTQANLQLFELPRDQEDLSTPSRFGARKVIGILLTGLAVAGGVDGTTTATAEAQSLTAVGPALSGNTKVANNQLDFILEKAGPNSVLAKSIAKSLHIKTAAGRAKFITPKNIDLGRKIRATNAAYPGNTGSTGSNAVAIPNRHRVSDAYTVVVNNSAASSESVVGAKSKTAFTIQGSVLRRLCENMLERKRNAVSRKPINNRISTVDVSFGVKKDMIALAAAKSESVSTTEVQCPDGTTVKTEAYAQAQAFSAAALQLRETGQFVIKATNTSFDSFKFKFSEIEKAEVAALASASTSTTTKVTCGNTTPPTVNPSIQVQKDFIASYNPDGTFYSMLTTKRGNSDKWSITIRNNGNENLNTAAVDTPPKGEVNARAQDSPFGFRVDGNGIGYFNGPDILTVNETEKYILTTSNINAPCFENLRNIIDVTGTDAAGKQVTAEDDAFTKEDNTGPDCINTPPPTSGPGQ